MIVVINYCCFPMVGLWLVSSFFKERCNPSLLLVIHFPFFCFVVQRNFLPDLSSPFQPFKGKSVFLFVVWFQCSADSLERLFFSLNLSFVWCFRRLCFVTICGENRGKCVFFNILMMLVRNPSWIKSVGAIPTFSSRKQSVAGTFPLKLSFTVQLFAELSHCL